jgi:hypothetical protein
MSDQWKEMTRQELLNEIKLGARFVRYAYCFSIIFLTYSRQTEPRFIPAGRSKVIAGLPWTTLVVFTGWWGLPWGPIRTVQCIVRNMRGGHDITDDVVNSLL